MELYVKGGYYLNIVVAGQSDFLFAEDDLISLVISEEAGNVLPSFLFRFKLAKENEKLLKYLNEGNTVDIRMGKTPDKTVDSKFVITRVNLQRAGTNLWDVTVTGLYDALSYVAESRVWSSDEVSGVECLKTVSDRHFTSKFEVDTSSDKQYWIQPNVTDRKFVTDVWLHSYRPNSFLGMGITSFGEFIVKDMLKDTNNKWKFGNNPEDEWIKYSSDYMLDVRSGLMNFWAGLDRSRVVWDSDEGEYPESEEEFKTSLALSKTFDRKSGVGNRSLEFRPLNENVDPYYWDAYRRNVTSLALFSAVNLTLQYSDKFELMRVLDRAYFYDDQAFPDSPEIVYHSGYYFISKITRAIDYKNLVTTVVLNREALSEIKGDLE